MLDAGGVQLNLRSAMTVIITWTLTFSCLLSAAKSFLELDLVAPTQASTAFQYVVQCVLASSHYEGRILSFQSSYIISGSLYLRLGYCKELQLECLDLCVNIQ